MSAIAPESARVLGITLFLLSIGLFVSSSASARQCYTWPCFEGDGLAMLWAVHDGEGFALLATSVLAIAQSVFLHAFLFRARPSKFWFGMVVGSSVMVGLVVLGQAGVFLVKSTMVDDLEAHAKAQDGYFYEQNDACEDYDRAHARESCNSLGNHCTYVDISTDLGTHGCFRAMTANTKVEARFNSVAAFSILLCMVHLLTASLLVHWREAFEGEALVPVQPSPAAGYGSSE